MSQNSNRTRLYLIAEATHGLAATGAIGEVLSSADVATLLLRPSATEPFEASVLKAIVAAAQSCNVATLIAGDARLARTLRADGVHLPWSADVHARYAEAREILGAGAIVGAEAGLSRHDAMTLGEAAADYVAFGTAGAGDGAFGPDAPPLELVSWWAEIFEVPVVAFGAISYDDATLYRDAGADFVAVTLPARSSADEQKLWLGSMSRAVRETEVSV